MAGKPRKNGGAKKPGRELGPAPVDNAVVDPRKKGLQAPHIPSDTTRLLVESLARIGTRQERIAEAIGINPQTLRKYYREELHAASLRANAAVAESLYEKATSRTHPGAVTAAIFWLKTRAQWTEPAERATNQLADAMQEFSRLFGAGPVLNHDMTDITPDGGDV